MLAVIRRYAKTWPARALFALLVGAFGLWGVAGRLYNSSSDTAVAKVGDGTVEVAEAQRAYARQMSSITKQNGADFQPPPGMRQQVANQAVQELVLEKLLENEQKKLGVTAPDAAVREATFALPAFKGISGQFDRQTFLSVLSRNNLDEASFIALIRGDVGRRQLTGAIEAGAAASNTLVEQIFAYSRETRTAAAVSLPIVAAAAPAPPTPAQLHRFWTDNPALYATPEYRRIRVIVLSPQTLARDMAVSDDDIKNYYNAARSTYDKPERRTVQVVSASDQAVVARLAGTWKAGADWSAIQAASKTAGATALELTEAKRAELPDAALGTAAFAAAPGAVSMPVKGDFGWYVVKVTKVVPAVSVPLAQARAEIREKIGVLKANEQMDDHANKIEDALAGGGGLDNLPQGLGVAAVEGTLDAAGMTPERTPAPLPAFPALRDAIIAASFKAHVGDAPHLEQLAATKENPGGAYYAVHVESITKPSQLGFDQVADRVRQDYAHEQMRHTQEAAAAQLLTTVRAGTPLVTAALARGLAAQTLPPVPRPFGDSTAPAGVPPALVAPLFAMKQGEATMVATEDGYMVAQLLRIDTPAPASDSIGAGQLRTELDHSVATDATDMFVQALQRRSKVSVNPVLVQQIAQP